MALLLLAFEAALYPTLLAAVVILLSQERRVALLSAYLAGGMVISIGLGLAILDLMKSSHDVKTSSSALSWGADLAVGGLALLLAVALSKRADERLRRRRQARHPAPAVAAESREPWSQRILARGSVPIVFAAGLVINVPGAAYLIALKDIAAGGHSQGTEIFQVVLFNLIMFLLAEIPLLGLLLAPDRTDRLVAAVDHWLSSNSRRIAVVVSGTLGVFLIARGIVHA